MMAKDRMGNFVAHPMACFGVFRDQDDNCVAFGNGGFYRKSPIISRLKGPLDAVYVDGVRLELHSDFFRQVTVVMCE